MQKVLLVALFGHVGALTTIFGGPAECGCKPCESIQRLPRDIPTGEGVVPIKYKCAIKPRTESDEGQMRYGPETCANNRFQKYNPDSTDSSVDQFQFQFCSAFCKPKHERVGSDCEMLTDKEAGLFGDKYGLGDRRIPSKEFEEQFQNETAVFEAARAAENAVVEPTVPSEKEVQALQQMEVLFQEAVEAVEKTQVAAQVKSKYQNILNRLFGEVQ